MKVLFDHNVPRKLRRQLGGHDVRTAREMGWAELENGELLAVAEATGFEVMVTADKNMSYQQRLKDRRLAIVVLSDNDWIVVKESAELISLAIERAEPGSFQFVLVGRQSLDGGRLSSFCFARQFQCFDNKATVPINPANAETKALKNWSRTWEASVSSLPVIVDMRLIRR